MADVSEQTTTASTPPVPVSRDIFLRAARHAAKALPPHLGDSLQAQFHHAADMVDGPLTEYAVADQIQVVGQMAWETLSLPERPEDDSVRVQTVARALWQTDFPPPHYMSWDAIIQQDPTITARYVELAKAALVADEAEHRRIFDQSKHWYDAWTQHDEDRPETPNPVILQSLTSWLLDHNIGICDEPDGDDGCPVYTDETAMTELAARLLTQAPGMRPAAVTKAPTSGGGGS